MSKKKVELRWKNNINNTNIYNNLINPYYLFLFLFQIDISNTTISLSKDENAISQLIDEMDDDADYENDEKWKDYFSFIDDELSNSCSISHDP